MLRTTLALSLLVLTAMAAYAAEMVGVEGSATEYLSEIEVKAGKPVKMAITGAALRKKFIFSVYTVASYVQTGADVHGAEELADKDCVKQLHLVMERDVKGKEMADAFELAIRMNYNPPQFGDDIAALSEHMHSMELKKGENVRLTNIPGKGLRVEMEGKEDMMISNPAFSKAVWEIYLGKNNLGEAIKKALISRL